MGGSGLIGFLVDSYGLVAEGQQDYESTGSLRGRLIRGDMPKDIATTQMAGILAWPSEFTGCRL